MPKGPDAPDNPSHHAAVQAVLPRVSALTLYARQWLDAAGAQDAVQEALTNLLGQSPLPRDPVAWMFRAVHNAAIDQARSNTRRWRREQSAATERREWFEPNHEAAIDAQAAEQLLAALDPTDRRIVVLRVWGDQGFAEIAQILGLAVSTVHNRYVAALAQMRSRLDRPRSETPCRNTMI
jgi:RNA polymerase sigma factor (sigma-70 family)